MIESKSLPRLLIVDDSRMVRAMLVKHIKGYFDYREEADGEAAWHALLLDQSIRAVISDLTMPVLDGYGLLQRIRNSRVSRIRDLPVIMISGDEDEDSRIHAKSLGASDFITKGVGFTELMNRLEALVNKKDEAAEQEAAAPAPVATPAVTAERPTPAFERPFTLETPFKAQPTPPDVAAPVKKEPVEEPVPEVIDIAEDEEFIQIGSIPGGDDSIDFLDVGEDMPPAPMQQEEKPIEQKFVESKPAAKPVEEEIAEVAPPSQTAGGLHSRQYVEAQLVKLFAQAQENRKEINVMVLGFDNYRRLCKEHGDQPVNQLIAKFSRLLYGKVRLEDILGNYDDAQFAVISPGTTLQQCMSFAARIREAINAANVAIQGQSLHLAISVGIAGNQFDVHCATAGDLLTLAARRMFRVMAAGGNRVLGAEEAATLRPDLVNLERALAILDMDQPEALATRAVPLTQRLLPLLEYIDKELKLDLPMERLARRIEQLADSQSGDDND